MARIWRFLVAFLDWRTGLRKLAGYPAVDVVFISNMRDEKDRRTFLGKWIPPEGHFNGPRYWLGNISGRTRVIDVTAEDLTTREGQRQARAKFLKAVEWAREQGAKAVLFAAGTKRLFEGNYASLEKQYPGILFTIGDNGTSLLLKRETLRALEKAGLTPGTSRIGILGPYGFLGELMTGALKDYGYEIIGAGPNKAGLARVKNLYQIDVCRSFEEMGKVDAVVACTHSDKVKLGSENIDLVRRNDRKLLVIDVAEPSNLTRREYMKCRDRVIRQDAGNAYAPRLKYVLGAITYKMFRLSRGVTFGCFAETMALAWAMKDGHREVAEENWLEVTVEKMEKIAGLFDETGFTVPSPRCFSRPVKSFDLKL